MAFVINVNNKNINKRRKNMKKELSVKLNKYLSNLGVEYIKLHNLHWNVVGIQFKAIHEYLEGLYDGVSEFGRSEYRLCRVLLDEL